MRENPPPDDLVQSRDPQAIAAMFNRIARTYDLMNRLMTLGQDGRWRRLAADAAQLRLGDNALDVASGTGDMARELARRVGPTGSVIALDIAADMLAVADGKSVGLPIANELGDVCDMGYQSRFSAVTVAFGLRNFVDRELAMRAMASALKPSAVVVVLELVPTSGPLKPLIDWYEHRLIPTIGTLVSRDRTAYRYLPASVAASVTSAEIAALMTRANLVEVRTRELNLGTVAIVRGAKPAS